MSPSKSKSKDKAAARAVKEQPKASSKPSVAPVNGGNGMAASGYNPMSGTFHALEIMPSNGMPAPQSNGRFRTIDETEDHSGSSLGTAAEYDSVSNNDSCSGESEDQQKEKNTATASRMEPVPGSDTDKQEKIRLKNEKKHQRQRERRAHELHERCCTYLTSRKLESLAQKLVAMGFTSEQATMALIHNEGHVTESALWLLEGGEESRKAAANLDGSNPKIDIAAELTIMAELEMSFRCTKQEVERVVVTCEGDLEKAEETLKAQKQESAVAPPKFEEPGDQPTVSANGFHNSRLIATPSQNPIVRTQVKGVAPASVQLQRRDERDFNYTKSTIGAAAQMEAASRNLQQQPALRKVQSKPDLMKPQVVVPHLEKRWPSTSASPSTPYSMASPLQVAAAQAKPETRYVSTGGSEVKSNFLQGTLREPIFVMQHPQSNRTRQNIPPSSVGLSASPPESTGWYPSGTNGTSAMEIMKLANGGLGQQVRNLALVGSNSQQFYPQDHHQQFISSSVDSSGWGGSYYMPGATTRSSSSSLLAVPSSLGLFTGWGSSGSFGSSSPVDWGTRGSIPQCDYTSIDWSLDSTPLPLPSSSIKVERSYDNSYHASYTPSKVVRQVVNSRGVCVGGLQDRSLMADHPTPSAAGSHEWTSPFGGKDLFRVPRLFVTSPSP